MIAADGERVALDSHVEDHCEDIEDGWATVYEIADEDSPAALRVLPGFRAPGFGIYRDWLPAQLCEQEAKFCSAAVNVANDVVGAGCKNYQTSIMA